MAGDWIKMRCNLWDDPRVARLCDLTGTGEAAIVGGLYWLWAAADQHSEYGIMPGLSVKAIDRKTGVNGFGAAMIEIGWLVDHPEGVRIVRFEEHNGTSAKRRCSESRRKMSARDADKERTESRKGAEETQQLCAPRVREEKIKENTSVSREKIAFDGSSFQNLNGHVEAWRKAYPAIDIETEISKAAAWLVSNPKNKKSQYGRFLNGWLSRAQDKAPRVATNEKPRLAL